MCSIFGISVILIIGISFTTYTYYGVDKEIAGPRMLYIVNRTFI